MLMLFSTPSPDRSRPNRPVQIVAAGLVAVSLLATATPAPAQQVVFDPRNHIENALQAARQLESLANEAKSLAASPYSHLTGNSQSLRDMAELARTARGIASSVSGLEQQFQSLYPDDLSGSDMLRLLEQGQARTANARRTAEDVARTAAELERLGQGRNQRLTGALSASEAASGQTAAIQSSNQMLAVLAEDLAKRPQVWVSYLKAILRAERFIEEHRTESVDLVTAALKIDRKLVAEVIEGGNTEFSSDPNVDGIVQFWDALRQSAFVQSDRDIRRDIDTTPFKAALQSLISAQPGDSYWKAKLAQFNARN